MESGITIMDDFCTEEVMIVSKEEAKLCFDYNHKIIQVHTAEEIKQLEEEFKKNNKFCYTTNPKENVSITETILDFKIIPLRPIYYNHETTKRMILVYLPTKIEKETGKDDEIKKTVRYANKAYFIVQNRRATVRQRREILPIEDVYFKDKFKINIQPEWNDTRWQISNLKNG